MYLERLPWRTALAVPALLCLSLGAGDASAQAQGEIEIRAPVTLADPPVPAPAAQGRQWSIAILPDPQRYNQSFGDRGYLFKDRYVQQIDWIVANRRKYNIRFAANMGDSVQSGSYDEAKAEADPAGRDALVRGEWRHAVAATNRFHVDNEPAKPVHLPYAVARGNHDGSPQFETFFGPGRWNGPDGAVLPVHTDWYLGNDRASGGAGRQSAQTFEADGRTFLHLALDYAPTDASLRWGQEVMRRHPGMPVILTTHGFLDGEGKLATAERLKAGGRNGAPEIFRKLISGNDRIFLVLCGHMWLQSHAVLTNAAGHDVHAMEQCYHLRILGGCIDMNENPGTWAYKGPSDTIYNGSGWMTLLMFDPDEDTITRYTYSPVLDDWATDRPKEYRGSTYPNGDDVVERFRFDFDARLGPRPAP